MITQFAGAILLSASILATAWVASTGIRHYSTLKREKMISERMEKQSRVASSERLAKDSNLKMYEDEHEMRIAAETKLGIKDSKIARQAKEIERLKKLLETKEAV